jgi:sialidase-1
MVTNARWATICIVGLLLCALYGNANAQKPLFEIDMLFDKVRIPTIAVTTNGTILAFAGSGTLLRHSNDGGKNWSETETLDAEGGKVVIDENTGHALVVCPAKKFLLRSQDDGKSWEKEKIVVKPNAAGHGAPDNVPSDVTCSESGITLKFGENKGRLLMAARVQPPNGSNDQEYWPYNYNTALYSDDGGKTWQTSSPVQSGTGEGTLAELSDGRVYYNSRCHMAIDHRRRIAWSHDGGHMWVDWQVSDDLFEVGGPHYFKYSKNPSYGCNAGLVRIPSEVTGGKDVLLFSTPDNPGAGDKNARIRMTVWASFDRGKTWPVKRLVYEGPSAYSSLAADKTGTIYLLFESGKKQRYERISLARFNLEWLTQRQDWQTLLQN